MSKDASRDAKAAFLSWTRCATCKSEFVGGLGIQMARRFWREHRSGQHQALCYNATRCLANCLARKSETATTIHLYEDALKYAGNDTSALLEMKLSKADMLAQSGHHLEAMALLEATLPEAKAHTLDPNFTFQALQAISDVALELHRYQASHDAAKDLAAFAIANYDEDDPFTLSAKKVYATSCAQLCLNEDPDIGTITDILDTKIRIFGQDHPKTQHTKWAIKRYNPAAFPEERRKEVGLDDVEDDVEDLLLRLERLNSELKDRREDLRRRGEQITENIGKIYDESATGASQSQSQPSLTTIQEALLKDLQLALSTMEGTMDDLQLRQDQLDGRLKAYMDRRGSGK